jgi:hypothetical protein
VIPKQTKGTTATATFSLVLCYTFVLPLRAKDDRLHYDRRQRKVSQWRWCWRRQSPLKSNEHTYDTQTNQHNQCDGNVLFSLVIKFRLTATSLTGTASRRSTHLVHWLLHLVAYFGWVSIRLPVQWPPHWKHMANGTHSTGGLIDACKSFFKYLLGISRATNRARWARIP